jgi:hypothetical protein
MVPCVPRPQTGNEKQISQFLCPRMKHNPAKWELSFFLLALPFLSGIHLLFIEQNGCIVQCSTVGTL